jgi:hypothetical protein
MPVVTGTAKKVDRKSISHEPAHIELNGVHEIDQIVSNLCGLTEEEIKVVEESTCRTRGANQ